MNRHAGSDFDDFLREEGVFEACKAVAVKRVLALQIARAMEERQLSKSAMADRMNTSRSVLDKLLDPGNPSATLLTLEKAARAVGKRLKVELVDAPEASVKTKGRTAAPPARKKRARTGSSTRRAAASRKKPAAA